MRIARALARSRLQALLARSLRAVWVQNTLAVAAFAAALWIAPFFLSDFWVFTVSLIAVYGVAALGYNILLGNAGQVSLAQAAFFGIGAYTVAIGDSRHWPLIASLAAGVLLSAALSLVIGSITLRLGGFYLALGTLGVATLLEQVASQATALTGGSAGIPVPSVVLFRTGIAASVDQLYTAAALVVVACVTTRNLLRSRIGRAMAAIRDVEVAAGNAGIDVFRYRLLAFVLSGFWATFAGAVYAGMLGYITPDQFGLSLTIRLLGMVVVGGLGAILGAFVGSAFFEILPRIFQGFDALEQLVFGVAIMLSILFLPGGVVSFVRTLHHRIPRWRRSRPKVAEAAPASSANAAAVPYMLAGPDALPTGRAPILEVDELTKRFGGIFALTDVSFSVLPGRVTGLIGPNGSGKTTLLNCISGVYAPTSGRIRVSGADVTGRSMHLMASRGVRRTFQEAKLVPALTVTENVMLGAHIRISGNIITAHLGLPSVAHSDSRARSDALELLEWLGLRDIADVEAKLVSGPTRKSVEIARALIARPRVLMLDEVAAGLNTIEKQQLLSRLTLLKSLPDFAMIVVEHDLDFVLALAEHVVVLDSGRLIAQGSASDVQADSRVKEAYLGVG